MDIPKAYNPKNAENNIYEVWKNSGFFNPDICIEKQIIPEDAEIFSVMMPPPNVTGILHLGHAFENTLMDIQARYHRMLGKKTLFLPGTDHAAVATQAKVEKLLADTGILNPRKELGREKLLQEIREFAEESQKTILNQIEKMGASCDWSRLAYTLDETRSQAVHSIFKKMYDDGLIYQGYRVVNWSVKGQSTCSDDELEHVARKAQLYYFKYSAEFPITIATTRPETKLGDTAVAVHPEDVRYKEYIGKTFTVDVGAAKPLDIKIISNENIDPEYGTGALGVTPAHSQIDFELYEKNDIELIQVIGQDGKMTKEAGTEYEGLSAEEARAQFVTWLKSQNLLEKVEEIDQNVSTSDRFKDIIEAIPMRQWFVAVNKEIPGTGKSLKNLMKEAVTTGHNNDPHKKITITPDRFNPIYSKWIDNLRDWCISRQIWWGHQVPIWYKVSPEQKQEWDKQVDPSLSLFNTMKIEILDTMYSEEEPTADGNWIQDPDTLDTWFSSGTWTFSTLGWPKQTPDFAQYHPTTWMQMGHEILFFWMARMILMSCYGLDEIPFKDVYIHGILRDIDGRKFSKSLGNGIDPLDMIEKYGTDALRLGLIADITAGNDSRFYEEKVEYFRNFINKLWNISRYVLMTVEKTKLIKTQPEPKTMADKWILLSFNTQLKDVRKNLDTYEFSPCIETLRNFMWNDFADWYLEIAKIEGNKDDILLYILQNFLKILHPFAPFITEELWKNFAKDANDLLMIQSYPEYRDNGTTEAVALEHFEKIKEIITGIRTARAERKIEPKIKLPITIDTPIEEIVKENESLLLHLARLESITYTKEKPERALTIVIGTTQVHLNLDVIQNTHTDPERTQKEIENLISYINSLEKKLANTQFIENAPEDVVTIERKKLQNAQEKLNLLKQ